jgi:hypothetical protein
MKYSAVLACCLALGCSSAGQSHEDAWEQKVRAAEERHRKAFLANDTAALEATPGYYVGICRPTGQPPTSLMRCLMASTIAFAFLTRPAVLPAQTVMADLWMGDDDFHQGAFRQTIGVEFESWMQMSRDMSERFPLQDYDIYEWYLRQGTLASVTRALAGRVPTWHNFVRHPTYDTFWVARSLPRRSSVAVPTLVRVDDRQRRRLGSEAD